MTDPPHTPVAIGYVALPGAAWRRARALLFQPFEARTWLVLGFAAWRAGLMEGTGGGGAQLGIPKRSSLRHGVESARHAWEHLLEHPWVAALLVAGGITAAVVLVLLLWASSRAKFVFLDNVVTRRAAIVEPWRRTRQLGTSLFLWRLGFFGISLAVAAILASLFYFAAGGWQGLGFATTRAVLITVMAGLTLLVFFITVALVTLFLDSFVVPLMAHANLTAGAAWAAFLPWLEAHTGAFVLYALFVLALWVGVGLAVVAAGFAP